MDFIGTLEGLGLSHEGGYRNAALAALVGAVGGATYVMTGSNKALTSGVGLEKYKVAAIPTDKVICSIITSMDEYAKLFPTTFKNFIQVTESVLLMESVMSANGPSDQDAKQCIDKKLELDDILTSMSTVIDESPSANTIASWRRLVKRYEDRLGKHVVNILRMANKCTPINDRIPVEYRTKELNEKLARNRR